MKKTIATIITALIVLSASAQTKVRCNIVKKGYWINNEWVWSEPSYEIIDFTLYKNDVYVSDKAHSHYQTYNGRETKRKDSYVYTWDATDENGRSCALVMNFIYESKSLYLTVMYNDVAFDYKEQQGLSNLNNN